MTMNSRFNLCALPRTVRGQPFPLNSSPDNTKLLYTHGHSVIIREFAAPQYADIYTQHSTDVLVAKYSPSGFYIASADKSGKVRIWDTVNKEHILKNEFQPLSGPIKDLAWSSDNQRMVVVGEGREKYGHVFLADTGTSNGDITGQSRPVNSVDFRPARPFRIITGSEDNTAAVYEGPPFKFKCTKTDHSRYCQVVRYSPNATFWASAGFDGKVFLYEGKDSEFISEISDDGAKAAHDGGIYGLAWSGDSKSFLTASGDKTCKVWDLETRKSTAKFVIGDQVSDQQLGCVWAGDYLVSVSLSGVLNYLDPRAPGKPQRVIQGHNKPITALTKVSDKSIYTGDSDGRVIQWETENGVGSVVEGGATCQVNGLTPSGGDAVMAVSIDDCVRKIEGLCVSGDTSTKLNAQPKSVCNDEASGLTFVATVGSVCVVKQHATIQEVKVDYEPACIAVSPKNKQIIVGEGGHSGKGLHVYSYTDAGSLDEVKTVVLSGQATAVAYSPDESLVVSADANRKVTLFNVPSYEKSHSKEWGFHTARVNCVSFSPNGQFVASGGLDCAVIVWSVSAPAKHHILASAHVQSQITGVCWMDDSTVVSSGQDGNVKVWNMTWKPE